MKKAEDQTQKLEITEPEMGWYDIKDMEKRLQFCIKTMRVPAFLSRYMSQNNLLWMHQNLATKNAEHPELNEALNLVNQLLKSFPEQS